MSTVLHKTLRIFFRGLAVYIALNLALGLSMALYFYSFLPNPLPESKALSSPYHHTNPPPISKIATLPLDSLNGIDRFKAIQTAAEIYRTNFYLQTDPQYIKTRTYLFQWALRAPESLTQPIDKQLKNILPEKDPFLGLFHEALTWAKLERKKSAKDLYHIAHNLPAWFDPAWHDFLHLNYLKLAAEKGHPQAQQEVKILSQQRTQEIKALLYEEKKLSGQVQTQ